MSVDSEIRYFSSFTTNIFLTMYFPPVTKTRHPRLITFVFTWARNQIICFLTSRSIKNVAHRRQKDEQNCTLKSCDGHGSFLRFSSSITRFFFRYPTNLYHFLLPSYLLNRPMCSNFSSIIFIVIKPIEDLRTANKISWSILKLSF